jgi:hypothetical protein
VYSDYARVVDVWKPWRKPDSLFKVTGWAARGLALIEARVISLIKPELPVDDCCSAIGHWRSDVWLEAAVPLKESDPPTTQIASLFPMARYVGRRNVGAIDKVEIGFNVNGEADWTSDEADIIEAVIQAQQLSLGLEPDGMDLVVIRNERGIGFVFRDLEIEHERLGDIDDRQISIDFARTRRQPLHLGAREGNIRKLLRVQEVAASQVLVAVGVIGIDTGCCGAERGLAVLHRPHPRA